LLGYPEQTLLWAEPEGIAALAFGVGFLVRRWSVVVAVAIAFV
jgi:hypothetical protein